MDTQTTKTRKELAEAVRQQADLLKKAVEAAQAAGLEIKFQGGFIGPIRVMQNPFGLSIREINTY